MLVAIGILIILLLIIIIFYQNLVSAKVKIEDAQDNLTFHLKQEMGVDESNIEAKLNEWQKEGLSLNKEAVNLFEYLEYTKEEYNAKLLSFPYSLMAEVFKMKKQ